jgi:hypothetical protein
LSHGQALLQLEDFIGWSLAQLKYRKRQNSALGGVIEVTVNTFDTDVVIPSHCGVCHHVAVGEGWQLLYRLCVFLDFESIVLTYLSQLVMNPGSTTIQIPSSTNINR